jgi:hypothetical protein
MSAACSIGQSKEEIEPQRRRDTEEEEVEVNFRINSLAAVFSAK